MEVIGILDIGEAVTPPDDSISTAKIQDDAVTADKLANSINTEIAANTAKVTNATHTGDVTGATALTIATDAVDIAMLSATGTADATTFLRGDNAWASAGGDNTPAFMVYQGSTVTGLTDNTIYKVPMDTVVFDTDSAFDHVTNYRFTVPAGEGGKYSIFVSSYMGMGRKWNYGGVKIYVNGVELIGPNNNWDGYAENFTAWITTILDLSATDYVEVYSVIDTTDGSNWSQYAGTRASVFGGYKLII